MAGNHNSGRKPKYLTIEKFEAWKSNEFCHLVKDVRLNRKLLIGILFTVIVIPTTFMILIVQILAG